MTVRRALRPWVDLDELGLPGLWVWLETIAPLLPKPAGEDPGAPRVEELARALADCAGDRARAHFQAAEYFRENQALARRVKALEAMLALRRATDPSAPVPGSDPEAEVATRRYLRGQRP